MAGEKEGDSLSQPNILFICLDSLRYDSYLHAETPNFDSIGKPMLVHSQACWTIPSITGYLLSQPPLEIDGSLFPPYDKTKIRFVPKQYKEEGYETAFLSSNAYLYLYDKMIGGSISKWFNHWVLSKYLKERFTSTDILINDAVKIVKSCNAPMFMFLLLMDTHSPYHDGKTLHERLENRPNKNIKEQANAVSYIDRQIKPLLDAFRKKGKTIIYVTSDHGEHAQYGHDPSSRLEYTDKLFEIPFIKGELGS